MQYEMEYPGWVAMVGDICSSTTNQPTHLLQIPSRWKYIIVCVSKSGEKKRKKFFFNISCYNSQFVHLFVCPSTTPKQLGLGLKGSNFRL